MNLETLERIADEHDLSHRAAAWLKREFGPVPYPQASQDSLAGRLKMDDLMRLNEAMRAVTELRTVETQVMA